MILINCKNKILGRISSLLSKLLIFFEKIFKINIILYNVSKIIIKNFFFFSHSGYIGNLKNKKKNKFYCIKKSIYNMLPKNKNRIKLIKKIFFFE